MAKNLINPLHKAIKEKPCRECGENFTPYKSTQVVCSNSCAIELSKKKVWKAEKQKMIDKARTRTEWLNLAQVVFNTFIRLRDAEQPCISCGTRKPVKYDAGHFWATTYSGLRFHEDNVHKQCSHNCNMMKSGNHLEYRIRLTKRIGEERVQWLDEHRHDELKFSEVEIKYLIEKYKKKIKELKKD